MTEIIVSDFYTCPTCGAGVFTTMGQHICTGWRESSSPGFMTITGTGTSYLWNGPLCARCGHGYLGACTRCATQPARRVPAKRRG